MTRARILLFWQKLSVTLGKGFHSHWGKDSIHLGERILLTLGEGFHSPWGKYLSRLGERISITLGERILLTLEKGSPSP